MDWRTALYVLIGLVYLGFPLYYITSRRGDGNARVLGLGLLVYGLLGTFWKEIHNVPVDVVSSMMIVFGFGLYMKIVMKCFVLLLVMGYCIIVLTWPTTIDPLIDLVAALVLVVGFDRCMVAAREETPNGG